MFNGNLYIQQMTNQICGKTFVAAEFQHGTGKIWSISGSGISDKKVHRNYRCKSQETESFHRDQTNRSHWRKGLPSGNLT
jgi:hypothetical protein